MPTGVASAMTMLTKLNTRPCISGCTVSCSRVMTGVENSGTKSPNRNMKM